MFMSWESLRDGFARQHIAASNAFGSSPRVG